MALEHEVHHLHGGLMGMGEAGAEGTSTLRQPWCLRAEMRWHESSLNFEVGEIEMLKLKKVTCVYSKPFAPKNLLK